MIRFLIRLGINIVAIYLAILIVPIHLQQESWSAIVVLAVILGLVNALIAPVLKFLTCPFILVTLGLFTLIINTIMLWLTGVIGGWFGYGFKPESMGFFTLFLGALIIAIVNLLLSAIFKDGLKKQG